MEKYMPETINKDTEESRKKIIVYGKSLPSLSSLSVSLPRSSASSSHISSSSSLDTNLMDLMTRINPPLQSLFAMEEVSPSRKFKGYSWQRHTKEVDVIQKFELQKNSLTGAESGSGEIKGYGEQDHTGTCRDPVHGDANIVLKLV